MAGGPRPPRSASVGDGQIPPSVARLTRAYETGDVDGIIALFADDVWLTMPPAPLEYQEPRPDRPLPDRDHVPRRRLPPG